jgi:hypothetical protein
VRLWRLDDPWDGHFAYASDERAWSEPGENGCERRLPPLTIMWQPDSDVIGDFTWIQGEASIVVVREHVGRRLLERFKGFELGRVEMVQDPKLKRPQRVTRRTKPRVWLPYEGPPLCALSVTASVEADRDRSSLRPAGVGLNGEERFEVEGVERSDPKWDKTRLELVWRHTPRLPGAGIYVPGTHLEAIDVFHVRALPPWILCTDAVRNFIMESRLTNIDLLEMGETF